MTSLWKGEFARLLVFGDGILIWRFGIRWGLTVLCQREPYRIEVVYRARPAVALSESVEGMRVPRSPPYPSVLDE